MPLLYLIECDGCALRTDAFPLITEAERNAVARKWTQTRPGYLDPGWHCPTCQRIRKAELPQSSA